MPELPDVEDQRRALTEHLPGARVMGVEVLDAGVLRNATAKGLRDLLLGCRFRHPRRHGKWLILPTDGPTLLIHNGMTGRSYFVSQDEAPHSSVGDTDRLVIQTDRGELRYSDLRKLRGVWIVEIAAEITSVTGNQGPDALNLSPSAFRAALHGRRGTLKAALMNQQVLAGLGNMLSDEICWRARVHPARLVSTLDDQELRAVHHKMQQTLHAAVTQGRIPRTRTWLSSTRQRDLARCPRCQTLLQRSSIAGRTSIWCPCCQPAA
jgi:formamidopyrimidine-DNA glycosylase